MIGLEEKDFKIVMIIGKWFLDLFFRSMVWWNFKEYRKLLKILFLLNLIKI